MFVLGLVFAGIAAAVHCYIFVLESLRWSAPATRKTFGIETESDLQATRPLALNQGFYNLFLAAGAIVGIVVAAAGAPAIGIAVIVTSVGAMFLAGLVLVISLSRMARAAVLQMAPPGLAVIFLLISLAA